MCKKLPRILLLATGGTIAGQSANDNHDTYISGSVNAEVLLASTDSAKCHATVHAEDIAAIGSQDMSTQVWHLLHQRIERAFRLDEADGVVITHGTDTLEETAFLLEMTLRTSRPVVIVGAMRPSDAPGADGPRVLNNALIAAASSSSVGRGIIVVSGDTLMDARCAYKAFTSGTEGMLSYPAGPTGRVSPAGIHYFTPPLYGYLRGELSLPHPPGWPRVSIIYVTAAMDEISVRAMLDTSPRGIVLAGVGHGNAPAWLLEALGTESARGTIIVRSSRLNAGTASFDLEVDDTGLGFVAAGSLNPQRSRLLLQLLLCRGLKTPEDIQPVFDAV
ncbi:asparaginase (plasmid) [Pantoea agglomerans]|uniref:asparaginase n=1 Tax=Enterobacter agglomerans TaxID=549 RepID=UPI0013CA8DDD|nr:asparaginase [Pantoea agglomerans]NEG64659.1 asparaginase [Pantoea agglomerans]